MLFLKSCPRCQGDMYLEKDSYGSFHQCLQCGNTKDLDAPSPLLAKVEWPVMQAGRRSRKSQASKKNAIA
ncbi:MAG: hypothetical protein IIC82_02395 [Chloroflexi bacterium]|nr:hypothetical protein [Chloroflexota bacterium]